MKINAAIDDAKIILKIKALNCLMSQYSRLSHPVYDKKMVKKITLLRLDIENMTGKLMVQNQWKQKDPGIFDDEFSAKVPRQ